VPLRFANSDVKAKLIYKIMVGSCENENQFEASALVKPSKKVKLSHDPSFKDFGDKENNLRKVIASPVS
jgi:hypothetical protein